MTEFPVTQPVQTEYLYRLTDDTGIFQHTRFGIPDRSKGYTADDNARALIVALMLYRSEKSARALDLMYTYLAFIHHAQNEDGSFKNFMDYDRHFIEARGSEDCFGRCLWALGFMLADSFAPENLQNTCRYMLNKAVPLAASLTSPRAQAYALIGLTYFLETPSSATDSYVEKGGVAADSLVREDVLRLVEQLALQLHTRYRHCATDDWRWFEDNVTYGNAILPWSLFRAFQASGADALRETAKESLDFLVSQTFSDNGYFQPIGCNGWLQRGGEAALYDEQPIEACETLFCCQTAFAVLGDETYREHALLCHLWYLGRNSRNQSLIDEQTGGCYDGIHADGLNLNQGSESIVSYCMAHLAIEEEKPNRHGANPIV